MEFVICQEYLKSNFEKGIDLYLRWYEKHGIARNGDYYFLLELSKMHKKMNSLKNEQ